MCRPVVEGTSVKFFFYRFQCDSTFLTINRAPYETFKNAAICSMFVMVPRPLAAARAMRSRTCADVIHPCWSELGNVCLSGWLNDCLVTLQSSSYNFLCLPKKKQEKREKKSKNKQTNKQTKMK